MLGGTVCGATARADQAGDGSSADDSAATVLLEELFDFIFHAKPHRLQIDVDGTVEIVFRHLYDARQSPLDPGVVECAVEAPVSIYRRRDHALDLFSLRDISLDEKRTSAGRVDLLRDQLARHDIDVGDGQSRPFLGAAQCARASDAGAAAGNENDFVFEQRRHFRFRIPVLGVRRKAASSSERP